MDVRHLIMDTCDLISIVQDKYVYIHRPIMIFIIEVGISIFFFFFSQGCEWMERQKRIIVDTHAYLWMSISTIFLWISIIQLWVSVI